MNEQQAKLKVIKWQVAIRRSELRSWNKLAWLAVLALSLVAGLLAIIFPAAIIFTNSWLPLLLLVIFLPKVCHFVTSLIQESYCKRLLSKIDELEKLESEGDPENHVRNSAASNRAHTENEVENTHQHNTSANFFGDLSNEEGKNDIKNQKDAQITPTQNLPSYSQLAMN